jgi:hypothetical protein
VESEAELDFEAHPKGAARKKGSPLCWGGGGQKREEMKLFSFVFFVGA